MNPPSPPPARVRITSSRRGATAPRSRSVARDLDEQTDLGDIYIDGLIRAQRRLSLIVAGLTVAGLTGLPLLLTLVPATRTLTVVGVPFSWFAIGVAVYPCAWFLARWYTRQSERIESDFVAVVEGS